MMPRCRFASHVHAALGGGQGVGLLLVIGLAALGEIDSGGVLKLVGREARARVLGGLRAAPLPAGREGEQHDERKRKRCELFHLLFPPQAVISIRDIQ